jgi:hypothetical protein
MGGGSGEDGGEESPPSRSEGFGSGLQRFRSFSPDTQRLLNAGVQPCDESRDAEGFGMGPDGF